MCPKPFLCSELEATSKKFVKYRFLFCFYERQQPDNRQATFFVLSCFSKTKKIPHFLVFLGVVGLEMIFCELVSSDL